MSARTNLLLVICCLAVVASTTQAFTTTAFVGSASQHHSRNNVRLFESSDGGSEEGVTTYVRCGKCQTSYVVSESDLGARGRGRRLECSVCSHSWFQSKDRLMELRDGFEIVAMPQNDLNRIATNIKEGKAPRFMGDAKLYVGNIAFTCHEDDLYEIFSKAGSVGDVSLVRDEEGKNRGFGFVTMRTKEDGERAIDELDGTPVRGRNIAVRESNN